MSDDLLKRLTYFAFKLEGKGQLESAASDAMAEAAERLSAHSTAIDGLRAEIGRMREKNEMLIVAVTMIERMAAGAIYSQESIHALAIGALKQLGDKP